MTRSGYDTIRINNPPSGFFQLHEVLHVLETTTETVLVNKEQTTFGLAIADIEFLEKDWFTVRCPECKSVLFEIDRKSYVQWSVRSKCRKCKQMIIVKGAEEMHYSEVELNGLKTHLKNKLDSGEYDATLVATSLLSLAQTGRLSEDDVQNILIFVLGDLEAMAALARVRQAVDQSDLDDIARTAEKNIRRPRQ